MTDVRKELLDLVAEAYGNRLWPRLEGLTDDEYLWEPVDDCWTVHPNGDGSSTSDWGLIWDEAPPFTTIAWRMCHLIDCYGSRRTAIWLGLPQQPGPLEDGVPTTAAEALDKLARAHDILVGYISAVGEDELWTKIGPIGGIYAEHTKLSLLLHQLDEVIHHGAEIALLRDLYRARRPEDPFVLAVLKGDRAEVERMCAQDDGLAARMVEADPGLMLRAAETGRWPAIPILADLGFPLEGPTGRGPLHHATAANHLDTIRYLVERGADTDAKDPTYDSTPLGWAEYFNFTEAADYLRQVVRS